MKLKIKQPTPNAIPTAVNRKTMTTSGVGTTSITVCGIPSMGTSLSVEHACVAALIHQLICINCMPTWPDCSKTFIRRILEEILTTFKYNTANCHTVYIIIHCTHEIMP